MKLILILPLLLTACALPGKPASPRTLGECMSARGDFGGSDGHESTYMSLQACQAEMGRRK